MNVIITDGAKFPIQPRDIDTSEHFWGAFDTDQKQSTARHIVEYCKKAGTWVPFTAEQFEKYYQSTGCVGICIQCLVSAGYGSYIILDADGRHHVTDNFITKCFMSSPVHNQPVESVVT